MAEKGPRWRIELRNNRQRPVMMGDQRGDISGNNGTRCHRHKRSHSISAEHDFEGVESARQRGAESRRNSPRRTARHQVVAVACLMLAVDAPLSEAQAWAQRLPGTDPEAVCAAIEELLQAYERPVLTTRACHIALATDS